MRNYEWCAYTYRHRLAFMYTAKKLIRDPELGEEMTRRALVHDMDKMLMYLFFDQTECQRWHVMHKAHHLESGTDKSYADLVETVIDYECAPMTKTDKPLNAFDFTHKLLAMGVISETTADQLFDIMHTLKIDRSADMRNDPGVKEFVRKLPEVTEEMILREVFDYLAKCEENELPIVLSGRIPL